MYSIDLSPLKLGNYAAVTAYVVGLGYMRMLNHPTLNITLLPLPLHYYLDLGTVVVSGRRRLLRSKTDTSC